MDPYDPISSGALPYLHERRDQLPESHGGCARYIAFVLVLFFLGFVLTMTFAIVWRCMHG